MLSKSRQDRLDRMLRGDPRVQMQRQLKMDKRINEEVNRLLDIEKNKQTHIQNLYKQKILELDKELKSIKGKQKTKSSGKKINTKTKSIKRSNMTREELAEARAYAIIQRGKRKKGCSLDLQQIVDLLLNNHCHYCGSEVTGLDRVDSGKGYHADNVQPCCRDCNVAKAQLSYDDFISMCKTIARRSKSE